MLATPMAPKAVYIVLIEVGGGSRGVGVTGVTRGRKGARKEKPPHIQRQLRKEVQQRTGAKEEKKEEWAAARERPQGTNVEMGHKR